MRNRLLYILILLFGALWACSDEPQFPDPGLDTTRTSIDTVRRDTIDSYRISMDISAPNGVERIEVLNGRNYGVIQEFAGEYRGKKEFTFNYDVDLREVMNDTTLLYIVKVIDRNMRSYNKGFTLNVKKFSSPDIKIAGESDVLGLVSSVFQLKVQFETGLNTIDSYQILFEDEVIDGGSFPDTLVHEYKYKQIVDVEMEKNQEYDLRVRLIDNKGSIGEKTMKLRLVEMKRPVKVTVVRTGKTNREYELFYDDENDRLDSMLCTYTSAVAKDRLYKFEYTEDGKMSGWSDMELDNRVIDYDFVYTYDDLGRLKTMDFKEGNPSTSIDVTDWYDHGGVRSFYYGTTSTPVENVHYTPELKGDGVVFSELWANSNRADKNRREHCEDMTAVLIPTYFPELPNVTITVAYPNEPMRELFFYKYIFEKSVYTYKSGNAMTSMVSYTTDSMGRLITLRRSTVNASGTVTAYWEYIFTYAE